MQCSSACLSIIEQLHGYVVIAKILPLWRRHSEWIVKRCERSHPSFPSFAAFKCFMKFRLKSFDIFPQVARKLAHLYNEEARLALLDSASGERAEELLQQAQHWMAGILRILAHSCRANRISTSPGSFASHTATPICLFVCVRFCPETGRMSLGMNIYDCMGWMFWMFAFHLPVHHESLQPQHLYVPLQSLANDFTLRFPVTRSHDMSNSATRTVDASSSFKQFVAAAKITDFNLPALLLVLWQAGQGWSSLAESKQLGTFWTLTVDGDVASMLQILSRLSMQGELHARRAEKESGGPFTEAARHLYHLATLGSRGAVRIFSFPTLNKSVIYIDIPHIQIYMAYVIIVTPHKTMQLQTDNAMQVCFWGGTVSRASSLCRVLWRSCFVKQRSSRSPRRPRGASTETSESQVFLFSLVKVPSPTFAWPCIFLCGYQHKWHWEAGYTSCETWRFCSRADVGDFRRFVDSWFFFRRRRLALSELADQHLGSLVKSHKTSVDLKWYGKSKSEKRQ